jgi:hypothetical protein
MSSFSDFCVKHSAILCTFNLRCHAKLSLLCAPTACVLTGFSLLTGGKVSGLHCSFRHCWRNLITICEIAHAKLQPLSTLLLLSIPVVHNNNSTLLLHSIFIIPESSSSKFLQLSYLEERDLGLSTFFEQCYWSSTVMPTKTLEQKDMYAAENTLECKPATACSHKQSAQEGK